MTRFEQTFGYPAEAEADAPGRVNILGEHTDYNDGFVLPSTIVQSTSVAVAESRDSLFRFHSAQLDAGVTYPDGDSPPRGFGSYLYGCVEMLRAGKHHVPPISVYVDSTVPIGAGLSSSAAMEVATLRALRTRFGLNLDDIELACAAQQAEILYTGVRCGIMDQMACSLGAPGHVLFLDVRTLHRSLIPLPPETEVLILDSGIPRSLSASAYNERRGECEQAARLLEVQALRDVANVARLRELPELLMRRARHVITENARVLAAVETPNAVNLGTLMNASHASLRDDFEVSVPPLDLLVVLLQEDERVFGAKLTGAGFGGACVALVHKGCKEHIEREVLPRYAAQGYRGSRLV
ncbi:MAG: galactokinase [Acidobacteriota bacterium]|nr:galactokinase [Acidobacteriota bacterium]